MKGITLDIFNGDGFNLASLTKAINVLPAQPRRLAELNLFAEEGITTTSLMVEKTASGITLVPNVPRGASGTPAEKDKRRLVPITTTHLPQPGFILADEVQNVRAFGSDSDEETVMSVVSKHLSKLRRNIDTTIEYQRIGALKGQILDADGSTVILDLFDTFGVAQTTHNMVLGNAATKVVHKVVEAKRKAEKKLGAAPIQGWRALCSPGFFDALTGHSKVEAAFERFMSGSFLREDVRRGFVFGGVVWEEYNGAVGANQFIEDGKALLVPEGVPDLLVTNFAPADYVETVNTVGLPYYAKQELAKMGKGVELEAQSNPISYCSRPDAIVELSAA